MSLKVGGTIGPYKLLHDFEAGANCRWAIAERDGEQFFVKEFHRPKYPPDSLVGTLREEKLERCRQFEDRHKRLVSAMGRVCAPGGNIVMPVNFFRVGLAYYHIAPKVDIASETPAQVASLPISERLVLLRLLSRSILTLHSQKIVHGDLKPSNVLIHRSRGGLLAPKLIDFDGSFFEGRPPDRDDMAFDQNYMAPEVLAYNKEDCDRRDVKPTDLGTAADVFSLGILLHEFWTGSRPKLPGGHLYPAEAVQAGQRPYVSLRDMDGELTSLIVTSLELSPARRPPIESIDAAIGAAQSMLRGGPVKKAISPGSSVPKVEVRFRAAPRTEAAAPPKIAPRRSLPEPSLATSSAANPSPVVVRKSRNLRDKES
ncbi:MAG TPA: serine/threonine-protein kinase [Acetobacteraceae bacterium]|nr:serine/threonine-protein kinase [Acetobacteraceae bacterium]